jgi:hypothetical protein
MGKIVCGNVKIVCRMGVYVLDLPYYHPGPRPDRSGSMEDLPRCCLRKGADIGHRRGAIRLNALHLACKIRPATILGTAKLVLHGLRSPHDRCVHVLASK